MKIILGIFEAVFVFLLLMLGATWFEATTTTRGYAKIKFKTFKHFYDINPSRWELLYCFVGCYSDSLHREYLRFGFIDWLKYRLWRTARNKHDTKKSQVESMRRVITAVKKDIKNIEILAEQQVREGVDIIDKVLQEKKK